MIPKFTIKSSKSVFGGKELHVVFHDPPTREELDQAVRSLDDCPFGYRITAGLPVNGINTEFYVKIHND